MLLGCGKEQQEELDLDEMVQTDQIKEGEVVFHSQSDLPEESTQEILIKQVTN